MDFSTGSMETHIGSHSVCIALVAVELAERIFGSMRGKQILLVGAGKMGELAARHLHSRGANSSHRAIFRREHGESFLARRGTAGRGSRDW